MHRVPLYEGLAAGCTSTEADIWSRNTSLSANQADLLVEHASKALTESRTLRSLYLDPLMNILGHQNGAENALSSLGVFLMALNTSLILLLDFKTSDDTTWDLVVAQLGPFRKNDWLTYWSSTAGVVQRPLTIVARTTQADPFVRRPEAPHSAISAINKKTQLNRKSKTQKHSV
jgi:hypothetical protein